jgi:hypothetical protein
MSELIVVLIVVGVVALISWPALRGEAQRQDRHQPAVTDHDRVRRRRPDENIPESQPDQER